MVKYSIIIPVYNTQKYLKKCIDSVLEQSFKDFEIVIINDGSVDDSELIINNYLKEHKNIKYIKQENKGLSLARNIGVENSEGEYILFLDSDDYINKDLLSKLYNVKNSPEIIRYQLSIIENNLKKEYLEEPFNDLNGIDAFKKIVSYKYVEPACLYCIKKEKYLEKGYKFKKDCYHEDFGLIPRIIVESESVTSINYVGYNYIKRKNSIMNDNVYYKERKKSFDMISHFEYLNKSKINDKVYKSFIANSVILKAKNLKGKDYKIYVKKLKEMKVFDNLIKDTFKRKLKSILMRVNLRMYLKVIK